MNHFSNVLAWEFMKGKNEIRRNIQFYYLYCIIHLLFAISHNIDKTDI